MSPQEVVWRERLASILVDIHFRPMEKKILFVLADGELHLAKDLLPLLEDEFARKSHISNHISLIRTKLIPVNHSIICEYYRRQIGYRYVMLLPSIISKK